MPLHWRPARELEMPATQDMHHGVLVPVSALRRDRRFDRTQNEQHPHNSSMHCECLDCAPFVFLLKLETVMCFDYDLDI